jgi:hypothetical protein
MNTPLRKESALDNPSGNGKATVRGTLIFAAAFFWLIAPIAVFFIFHKPFPAETWDRLREMAADLLAAGWILWIAIGIGRPFFQGDPIPLLERIALSGALGLGVLGLSVLGIVWAGIPAGAAVSLLCIILTLVVSVPLIRGIAGFVKQRPQHNLDHGAFSLFLGCFAGLSLLLSLGIALAPPAAWDALVYHLRLPQQILAEGSLKVGGDSLFRELPQNAEMLFTAAMALTGRAESAAVLGWGAACLALLGMTGTARRMGLRHALLPAALLLSGDTLARSMGWGYVDWISALFGYCALCAISHREKHGVWTAYAGLFAGFAAGTKYTAGIIFAVLILSVFSLRNWKDFLSGVVGLSAGFFLAFLPWIFRGIAFFGNPLPPLLDSGSLAEIKMAFFTGQPLGDAWWMAVVMPFLQSTIGIYGAMPFGVTIGPLLFAFLPGALVRRGGDRPADASLLKLCGLCALLFWAACGVGAFFSASLIQPRLYLSLFPGLALLAAYGFEGLWNIRLAKIRIGAAAAALGALVLAAQAGGFFQSWIGSGIPAYLTGSQTRTAYLENNLGWYMRAMDSIRSLPDGSKVLTLWEPRGFYCAQSCTEDATIDRWYLAMRSGKTVEEILAGWREQGITHVLLFDTGAEFERAGRSEYSPSDWEMLERLQTLLREVERFGGGYTLYLLSADE